MCAAIPPLLDHVLYIQEDSSDIPSLGHKGALEGEAVLDMVYRVGLGNFKFFATSEVL